MSAVEVVAGHPSDEELAAILVVLLQARAAAARPARPAPSRRPGWPVPAKTWPVPARTWLRH